MVIEKGECRARLEVYIDCLAPDELFASDWNDLSADAKDFYENNATLPCEGTGTMNPNCVYCKFSESDNEEFFT